MYFANMNIKKQDRKKITLKDVASVLSLTPATVSKALRDSSDISADTKERVKKKCQELGYRPNLLARSLINNSCYAKRYNLQVFCF
jgi:LacI family transcriptional regulator